MERNMKLLTPWNFVAGSQSVSSKIESCNSKIHTVLNFLMLFIIYFLDLGSDLEELVSLEEKKKKKSSVWSLAFLSVPNQFHFSLWNAMKLMIILNYELIIICKIGKIPHTNMQMYVGVIVCLPPILPSGAGLSKMVSVMAASSWYLLAADGEGGWCLVLVGGDSG